MHICVFIRSLLFILVLTIPSLALAGSISGGSSILNSSSLTQLEGWLGEGELTLTNIFTRGVSDNSTDWHSAVDGQGRTFTLIELDSGHIIGGFNPQSWSSTSTYSHDTRTFLFSITNDFKHNPPGSDSGHFYTYNSTTWGPTFGAGHDLFVNASLSGGYANLGYTYACRVGTYASSTCRDDFAGSYDSWQIDALETFTIAPYIAPEPSTALLVCLGLGALATKRRRL